MRNIPERLWPKYVKCLAEANKLIHIFFPPAKAGGNSIPIAIGRKQSENLIFPDSNKKRFNVYT
jgi:hypothetical protein